MAIDFSFPPELEALRLKVREFIDKVVRPTEHAMDEHDRDQLVAGIIKMRKAAHEWGLWLPHMPKECGGMGLGHVAMAAVSRRGREVALRPVRAQRQAPDEGNMHTLLHLATDEQKEKYLRPLCEGRARSCFAMTEPEVAGSDPTLIQTRARARRRRVGDQRPQVVHLGRARREVRDPDRAHRGRRRRSRRRATPRSSSTCRRRAGRSCATSRRCRAATTTARSASTNLRVPARQHARRPRPGPPARPGAARPGAARALHALDRPDRDGARHDGRPRARSASRTARCSPRSRASSG